MRFFLLLAGALGAASAFGKLHVSSFTRDGILTVSGAFTNGVCTVEQAADPAGPWVPARNVFTTGGVARVNLDLNAPHGFFRPLAVDLSKGREGFTNLVHSYGLLTTVAGAGGSTAAINKWRPEFEGGPATSALLSRPHIAQADRAGNIFIADKDAHGIRKVLPNGTIVTVAGVGGPGNGGDEPMPGTQAALWEPNGLWVQPGGTVYILDMGNGKIRRLDPDGMVSTLFTVPGGIVAGRGLWVAEDESLAFVSSGTVVKKWAPAEGVTDFASGFVELGNLVIDPWGKLVVTDRRGSRVWRIEADGSKTAMAGTGTGNNEMGGGDGQLAIHTGLNQVRGVWFLPTGAYFVATHRGSQVWHVDTDGYIHLFLHGLTSDTHAGDGTWFYNPTEPRVSEIRAITADHEGNLLITEHDSGYIRKVEFLRHTP